MLKVRQARKAGHDLYPDNFQMTGWKELWPVVSRRLSSEPDLAAALQPALQGGGSASCPGACQAHARRGELCCITTQAVLLQLCTG